MKVIALLSAGRHPASGAAVLPRLEAQMVRMAGALGETRGIHAGPVAAPASDALGHGLACLEHLRIGSESDPVPVLVSALTAAKPDLVLAGRRSQGNDETGLVPYAVAKALGIVIIPDAIAMTPGPDVGTVVIDQALPKGAKRRLTVRLPAVVTVHPNAPPPLPFAYGQARRRLIETIDCPAAIETPARTIEERPYRARPKIMRGAPAGASAADRLKAATGDSGGGTTNVLVHPTPEVAAREILSYLRGIGVLPPPA
jgi:electron transfer flavoprotein beta subunit